MFYDYRAARDHIFGVVRSGDKIERIDPNGLTMVERMLLVVLVEFAPHIEPSIASLVKMTGMCERTVRGTLRSLEKKGAIKTTSRHGGRSHYELTVSTSDPGKSCPPPRQQVPPCGNVTQGQELPPAPAADAGLPRQQMPPKQTNKADKKADNISAPPTASRSPARCLSTPS